jgi:hypothetical protein
MIQNKQNEYPNANKYLYISGRTLSYTE